MRLLILTFIVIVEDVLLAFLYLFVSRFVLILVVRIRFFFSMCENPTNKFHFDYGTQYKLI
jgi:hypothetical protein